MSERIIFRQTEGEKKIELVGREGGDRELFADGIHGFSAIGPVAKMNLYSIAQSGQENLERREVVCRLTLPINALFAISGFLNERIEQLKKAGYVVEMNSEESPVRGSPAKK